MKKIEPVAWLRFARKKPQLIEVSFHKTLPPALKNNGWVQQPLYTREALEAVAEAVKQVAFLVGYDRYEIKQIDIADIINQLIGE